jgi:hypothetical protein
VLIREMRQTNGTRTDIVNASSRNGTLFRPSIPPPPMFRFARAEEGPVRNLTIRPADEQPCPRLPAVPIVRHQRAKQLHPAPPVFTLSPL